MHKLNHLLSIDNLAIENTKEIFKQAEIYLSQKPCHEEMLINSTAALIFCEPSTRTRASFEIAAKRLGANVLNLEMARSSTEKGETLLDTVQNLEAMGCDFFVIRHSENHILETLAPELKPSSNIINAGDGTHAHPSQALLDAFTIQKHKGNLDGLTIAIVGDVGHSRVARSQISLFKQLKAKEIRLVGPGHLLPKEEDEEVKVFDNLKSGLNNVDVIILLRLQKERMVSTDLPDFRSYHTQFGLNKRSYGYANDDAIILHPGPVNRGVEIAPIMMNHGNCVILDQVTNGVAIRMSVMKLMASAKG